MNGVSEFILATKLRRLSFNIHRLLYLLTLQTHARTHIYAYKCRYTMPLHLNKCINACLLLRSLIYLDKQK